MKLVSCFNEKVKQVRTKGLLLQLHGDPAKAIEQEDQILKFKGGYIQIARCDNGDYWTHIGVHRQDCNNELLVESCHRSIEMLWHGNNTVLLSHREHLCKVSVLVAPAAPRHAEADTASLCGWGMSFPGGYIVLEEDAPGLWLRFHGNGEVIETRLDHCHPYGIEKLPMGTGNDLAVRISPPLQ